MFGFGRAARWQRRLRERDRAAYLVREDLTLQRELKANLRLAQRAVFLAKDDEALYERLFRRQPPAPLRQILEAELLLWMQVRDVLADLAGRDMIPDVYRREVERLRPYVEDLSALTNLARTAARRPLSVGEEHELAEILDRRR